MVVVNCLVYGLMLWMPLREMIAFLQLLSVNRETVMSGQLWRMLSYGFVHDPGVVLHMHLVANMVVLVVVGRPLERLVGWRGMAMVYFGGLVFGAVLQSLLFEPVVPLVGASAGVFAVILGFCRFYWQERLRVWFGFLFPVNVRGRSLAIGLLVGSFVLWLTSRNVVGPLGMIGHWAHIGGGLWGLATVRFMYYRKLPTLDELQEARRRREVGGEE